VRERERREREEIRVREKRERRVEIERRENFSTSIPRKIHSIAHAHF